LKTLRDVFHRTRDLAVRVLPQTKHKLVLLTIAMATGKVTSNEKSAWMRPIGREEPPALVAATSRAASRILAPRDHVEQRGLIVIAADLSKENQFNKRSNIPITEKRFG
jgi:hypothetical protein